MDKTITVRLGHEQDEALTLRAKLTGKTRSAVVRELLEKALADEPFSKRAGHLEGIVQLGKPSTEWGKQLRKQNWR